MAYVGTDLTLSAINSALSAFVLPDTDLNGASGFSRSFGSVEEVLRIMSGEVYMVPRYTIITNIVGGPAYQFQTEAQRDVFVAAQVTSTTGKTFVSTGRFLGQGEAGFVQIPEIALTGEVLASVGQGYLHAYKGPITFKNPSFAYTAADLAFGKLPAATWNGVAVPATGLSAHCCFTYSNTGTAL